MIYLIYGLDNFLIQKNLDKIIEHFNITKININHLDLENESIRNIIDDAETISLFSDKKILIIDNAYIFTGISKINITDEEQKLLLRYITNPNPNTILIFTVTNESLDERKKITKAIKNNYKIIECNKIEDISKYVRDNFNDYEISNKTINLLIDRVGSDLGILEQEINKIKTYKLADKNISEDDIISLTTKNISPDLFKLIEMIVMKNKKEAIVIYNEIIKTGEEPIKLIVMLSNNIRIIYQTKELTLMGYTESAIAKELGIHPYRVKLAKEKSRAYTSENLINILYKLSKLDINIKSGGVDKFLGFELFILTM